MSDQSIPESLADAHQHLAAGRLGQAEAVCRDVLKADANQPEAMHLLGIIACMAGRNALAVDLFSRAIFLQPEVADYHNNLGLALARLGRLDEAIGAYRKAIALQPADAAAFNNLAGALKEKGETEKAEATCREALRLKPGYAEAGITLGNILSERGCLDAAVDAYRTAIGERPRFAMAHYNLGIALHQSGRVDEAVASFRTALECQPRYPEALINLCNALKDRGEWHEAIRCLRLALAIRPDYPLAHSNLVYSLHFHPDIGVEEQRREQAQWNRKYAAPLKPYRTIHTRSCEPERRLKVAYVSADLCSHPVGLFLLPLLEAHDARQVQVFCYASGRRPDAVTARLRASAHVWRDVARNSDAALAEIIRCDGIDLLVDLSMHSAGSRLLAFALKPAPIQVSWLAYPGTTGVETIDYCLTDAHICPAGTDEISSHERPLRLPDSWCCYRALLENESVNELPASSAGFVTFGSLNKLSKIHDALLRCWSRILAAVEGSRLLMFCPEGVSRDRVRCVFAESGVRSDRLEFFRFAPPRELAQKYRQIDIALDSFPCNGMTTTCNSLWMGVPVVTLRGSTPVSRAGLSVLTTVGLDGFIADSEQEYERLAVKWAGNGEQLAEVRRTLRERMRASPIMDARRFARNVETAWRQAWREWCCEV